MRRKAVRAALAALLAAFAAYGEAETAVLPVREVSVFKDGLAVVACEGTRPVESSGEVVLDGLPQPVLGTFWPYSGDAAAPLVSATAAKREVPGERDAVDLLDLVEANVGARAQITELEGPGYAATIHGFKRASGDSKGAVILQTDAGFRAVAAERIRDVTFAEAPRMSVPLKEARNRLVLRLGWTGTPAPEARVGMVYVQKGLRWIPEYRVELDGNGTAQIQLQAALVNDLVDLEDSTVNFVVGVPSFAFRDRLDPMTLQEAVAQVAAVLPQQPMPQVDLSNAFSNAIMTQVASPVPAPPGDAWAEFQSEAETGRSEDLFVFSVPHVTLKKGERMSVPVARFSVPYENLYRLEVSAGLPPEVSQAVDPNVQAKLSASPKVMHAVRLTNKSQAPLTTAPALILRDGRVVAQSMMTYTPVGARGDLDLTNAVDIQATRVEREQDRTPNAMTFNGDSYMRVDVGGKIRLANFRKEPVTLEVTRYVAGQLDSAEANGRYEQLNVYGSTGAPEWWRWYAWPGWWHNLNGIGRVVWSIRVEPGKTVELPYTWHYFWR